ncbi:hypothetical protein [Dyella sp. M7H15-1]|nr:hypothetical protein [Dyella sp. M7H15-1]
MCTGRAKLAAGVPQLVSRDIAWGDNALNRLVQTIDNNNGTN